LHAVASLRIRYGAAALALAAVAIFVAAHALRAGDRCAAARDAATRASRAQVAPLARRAADRCADPRDDAWVIGVAMLRGDRATAADIARGMTRSSPDDYLGWLGLYRVTGDRGALEHAHALNPRAVPLT
jgi:hypothetical protein